MARYPTILSLASQVEEKPEASPLHQTAKQLLKKTYNLWLFGPLEPVIMSIKHILYINNNRQLKWVLCQGVLVTHFIEKHTPCACGIASLTPAIESLTQDLKSTPQTSSNWLRHLHVCYSLWASTMLRTLAHKPHVLDWDKFSWLLAGAFAK